VFIDVNYAFTVYYYLYDVVNTLLCGMAIKILDS